MTSTVFYRLKSDAGTTFSGGYLISFHFLSAKFAWNQCEPKWIDWGNGGGWKGVQDLFLRVFRVDSNIMMDCRLKAWRGKEVMPLCWDEALLSDSHILHVWKFWCGSTLVVTNACFVSPQKLPGAAESRIKILQVQIVGSIPCWKVTTLYN